MYAAGNGAPRILTGHTEMNGHMADMSRHVALTEAVDEALFAGSGRSKAGPVPSPAEFRAALKEVKDFARVRVKRQRDEARLEVDRLQNAISLLVQGKHGGHRNLGGNAGPSGGANGAQNTGCNPAHHAVVVGGDSEDSEEDDIRGAARVSWVGYEVRK